MSTRRSFLQMLGLGTGALAVTTMVGNIWIPQELIAAPGEAPTLEWMLAEATRQLAREIDYAQFKPLSASAEAAYGARGFSAGERMFGIDISLPDDYALESREEVTKKYIQPCMAMMGAEIREINPRYSLPMSHSVVGAQLKHQQSGFHLRHVRAWDPLYSEMTHRFDMRVA